MNQPMQPSGQPIFDVIEGSAENVKKQLNNMLANRCALNIMGMSSCYTKEGVTVSILVLWDKLVTVDQNIIIPQMRPPGGNLRSVS